MNTESKRNFQANTVSLPDGTKVPAIGQGTWHVGDAAAKETEEINALRLGIELGMTLIDTAEMYGEGKSEQLVGKAIQQKRDEVFLVSKVYPHHANSNQIKHFCEKSLNRLGTDFLDLYLLHWRGQVPLAEIVAGMEQLQKEGKIKRWGVSNFDTEDMKELMQIPGGNLCSVNQVLYHLGSRGIEFDLLPWHEQNGIPIMAYSPLAQGGLLRRELRTNSTLKQIAEKHQVTPLQIALAWTIRSGQVISIPKASQERHVKENAQAAFIQLAAEDFQQLDKAFPPPVRKEPLDII